MDETIEKLDQYLQVLRPEFYSQLNNPLTDKQIELL